MASRAFSAAVLAGFLMLVGYTDGFLYPLLILTAVLVHEGGHLLAALCLRVPLKGFSIHPAGLSLAYDAEKASYPGEAAVILSGPLAGVAASGIVLLLFGLDREGAFFFFFASLTMSVFNLLPAPSLDGGAFLETLLSWGGRGDLVPGILRVTGLLSAACILCISLFVQARLGGNLSLLAASAWLLYSLQKSS